MYQRRQKGCADAVSEPSSVPPRPAGCRQTRRPHVRCLSCHLRHPRLCAALFTGSIQLEAPLKRRCGGAETNRRRLYLTGAGSSGFEAPPREKQRASGLPAARLSASEDRPTRPTGPTQTDSHTQTEVLRSSAKYKYLFEVGGANELVLRLRRATPVDSGGEGIGVVILQSYENIIDPQMENCKGLLHPPLYNFYHLNV